MQPVQDRLPFAPLLPGDEPLQVLQARFQGGMAPGHALQVVDQPPAPFLPVDQVFELLRLLTVQPEEAPVFLHRRNDAPQPAQQGAAVGFARDRDDLVAMWPLAGLSPSEALDRYQQGYPHAPEDEFLLGWIEAIADESTWVGPRDG